MMADQLRVEVTEVDQAYLSIAHREHGLVIAGQSLLMPKPGLVGDCWGRVVALHQTRHEQ